MRWKRRRQVPVVCFLYNTRFHNGVRFTKNTSLYTVSMWMAFGMRAQDMGIIGNGTLVYRFVRKNKLEFIKYILNQEDLSNMSYIFQGTRTPEMLTLLILHKQVNPMCALMAAATHDYHTVVSDLLKMYTFDTQYIRQVIPIGKHNQSAQLLKNRYWEQLHTPFREAL